MAPAGGTSSNEDVALHPAADFEKLPLEFIMAAPLTAAVKAQAVAAVTTREFIKTLSGKDDMLEVVSFKATRKVNGQEDTIQIDAPLLAIVPVPHLRIDSLTVNFRYSIAQTVRNSQATEKGVSLDAESGALLSPWVKATLKGSLSSRASDESIMNRSGSLEITVHASEAPIPDGLAKVLSLLSGGIEGAALPPAPTPTE